MDAAKSKGRRRGPGRPFAPGDPRINRGGRRASPATAALHRAVTDEDLEAMWRGGLAAAQGSDARWAALIAAYLDGKPVQRNEHGEPGDFELTLDQARKVLQLDDHRPA